MPHLKGDPLAVYDAGFRERVRDQYTTEGMTSEEFLGLECRDLKKDLRVVLFTSKNRKEKKEKILLNADHF